MGGVKSLLSVGVIIVCTLFATGACLCSSRHWYDTESARCRPCTVCGTNHLTITPCTKYRDAVCLSFKDLDFSFLGGATKDMEEIVRPTHETEFRGVTNWAGSYHNREPIVQQHYEDTYSHLMFGLAIGCVLAIVCLVVVLVLISCRMSKNGDSSSKKDNYFLSTRARLFSRDRLNTTEYKHTLAGLDRKLAMDEILEKKRAMFVSSSDIRGNQYVDEVFVDLSTVPLTDVEGTRLLNNTC